ncbi:hypothetical protein ACEUD0_02570 [Aeromonas veronii]
MNNRYYGDPFRLSNEAVTHHPSIKEAAMPFRRLKLRQLYSRILLALLMGGRDPAAGGCCRYLADGDGDRA